MTEREWIACGDPGQMLQLLRGKQRHRKLRLFAVACCKRIWPLIQNPILCELVEVAERFADGEARLEELEAAGLAVAAIELPDVEAVAGWSASDLGGTDVLTAANSAFTFAAAAVSTNWETGERDSAGERRERAAQAILLRDVFPNPFGDRAFRTTALQSPAALGMARTIYADRAFDHLPILADALEEAGCTDTAILSHCRGPGPHVRGCWVVDLILGKE